MPPDGASGTERPDPGRSPFVVEPSEPPTRRYVEVDSQTSSSRTRTSVTKSTVRPLGWGRGDRACALTVTDSPIPIGR